MQIKNVEQVEDFRYGQLEELLESVQRRKPAYQRDGPIQDVFSKSIFSSLGL